MSKEQSLSLPHQEFRKFPSLWEIFKEKSHENLDLFKWGIHNPKKFWEYLVIAVKEDVSNLSNIDKKRRV